MRRETRTAVQIAADRLDLEIHRVAGLVSRFGVEHLGNSDGVRMADIERQILGFRYDIRKHMHPADRERTS